MRARSVAKSWSSHDGVGNGVTGERAGAVPLGAVVTVGGCTATPAWSRPESTGTECGAGTGSTGCSQNEDVPPSEGVPVVSMATGSAAVVPETVAGGSSHPRPRSPAAAPEAAAREGSGRPDAGGGPGTPVGWTSPSAGSTGSKNLGLIVGATGCAGKRISIRMGGWHGRRPDCRRWWDRRRQRSRRCRSNPGWWSLHGPDVLGGQGIERTVPGGQPGQLFQCDSIDVFQGLMDLVGSGRVCQLRGSTGHVFNGAVRLFRLGDFAGTPKLVFGLQVENPEPARDLLCDAVSAPEEIRIDSIRASVRGALAQGAQPPVDGAPVELNGSMGRRRDGCGCHRRSGRHRRSLHRLGGRGAGDVVFRVQRLQHLLGKRVDGIQGRADRTGLLQIAIGPAGHFLEGEERLVRHGDVGWRPHQLRLDPAELLELAHRQILDAYNGLPRR